MFFYKWREVLKVLRRAIDSFLGWKGGVIEILSPIIMVCIMSGLAFCLKNYIISGYILYPTKLFSSFFSVDWKITPQIQAIFYNSTRLQPFNTMNLLEYEQWTVKEKIARWFFSPKLYGFFNKLIVIVLIVMPFFINKNKALLSIYIYALLQFLLLVFTAPHYHLFFHIILILSLLMFSLLIVRKSNKLIVNMLLISVLLPAILLFFPLEQSIFTNNKWIKPLNLFHQEYIIIPHKNSQYTYGYEKVREGGLQYNSPKNAPFWFTGDGELPTVNKVQIDFF